MSSVLQALIGSLESDLKRRIVQRVETMLREIRFLQEREDERLSFLLIRGWSLDRLEVLCELNAFYQIVLGPLSSSARERTGSLGNEIPIIYGSTMRFDITRARRIQAAHRAFMTAVADLPLAENLLTANHAGDIVFRLRGMLRNDSQGPVDREG